MELADRGPTERRPEQTGWDADMGVRWRGPTTCISQSALLEIIHWTRDAMRQMTGDERGWGPGAGGTTHGVVEDGWDCGTAQRRRVRP